MTCANKITEYNKEIPCWLPKDPASPFGLCARCTHFRTEHLLNKWKEVPVEMSYFENKLFQRACFQEAHLHSLLNLLVVLCEKKSPFFEPVYRICITYSKLESKLDNEIDSHTCSTKCFLYQFHMKRDFKLGYSFQNKRKFPLNCWNCIAWILREKESVGSFEFFLHHLLSSRTPFLQSYSIPHLIDSMISLELKGKGHASRTLFDCYRRHVKDEAKAKETLHLFLSQPAFIHQVFNKASIDYYPYVWQKEKWKEGLQKDVLKNVRKRNWVFKEELIMRTWAPHRLFRWCFDIEDLKDFDNPLEENFEQIG
jgi:hypothetical protein